jgi:peptidoglycan/LPS O-acetylase OafA/YrhL
LNQAKIPKSHPKSQRLAWLEGLRIFAAIAILLYHYQLLFTDYAFTPQPIGFGANLVQMGAASAKLGAGLGPWLSLPIWFGYQFVDVFVLISGLSLVLSLKGQPLQTGIFLKKRIWRILLPFWTVAWLSYPVLWTIGKCTDTYIPDAWHTFAVGTFPLLFEYSGRLLLSTSGPWWFMPLIISFAAIFPLLWALMQRWGARNLLFVTTGVTLLYRALAVYVLGGHPTYTIVAAAAGWQPFVPFIAKLGTFAIGMWVATRYQQLQGPLLWPTGKALKIGLPIYAIGFVCQFYQWGWIVADELIAIGLSLCGMVICRWLSDRLNLGKWLTWLGRHSYSYFLIHNFVIDRLIRLVVKNDLNAYYRYLPIALGSTLLLAIIVDRLTPLVETLMRHSWAWCDRRLSQVASPINPVDDWQPQSGDRVYYQESPLAVPQPWVIRQVKRVEHEYQNYREILHLCQIENGRKTLWVNQQTLRPRSGLDLMPSAIRRD